MINAKSVGNKDVTVCRNRSMVWCSWIIDWCNEKWAKQKYRTQRNSYHVFAYRSRIAAWLNWREHAIKSNHWWGGCRVNLCDDCLLLNSITMAAAEISNICIVHAHNHDSLPVHVLILITQARIIIYTNWNWKYSRVIPMYNARFILWSPSFYFLSCYDKVVTVATFLLKVTIISNEQGKHEWQFDE